jgi:hypothetical protein
VGVLQGVTMDSLKFYLGPPLPYPSTRCGQATPETALRPFQGSPTRRTGDLRLSSTSLDTPRRTPMNYGAE